VGSDTDASPLAESVPGDAATAGEPDPSGVSFHPPGPAPEEGTFPELDWEEEAAAAVGTMTSPGDEPEVESFPDPGPDPVPAVLVAEDLAPRITCGGVGVMASDRVLRAEVQLRAGEVEARGTREGPNHADSDIHFVAAAALDAVAALLSEPVLLHLKEVRVADLGGQDVVVVAVDLVEGRSSDTLFGACSTRHNRQQAVVHAVLDALNRRLGMYSLKASDSPP
jgi:hypothetical protein